MAAEVVYSAVSDEAGVAGKLFQGKKFWLSRRVPQRTRFISEVKANGGEVLPQENEADIKIVDHARKESLPGTYSYTYIEKSVQNGALELLDEHAVGPSVGTSRSLGSASWPAKSSRTQFTEDEDRLLWNWVQDSREKGGATAGNEIYKQLEATNSRHTWQSWRDRYVKHLKGRKPNLSRSDTQPISASEQSTVESRKPVTEPVSASTGKSFSDKEAFALYDNAEDILSMSADRTKDEWEAWAKDSDLEQNHTANEWQEFWEKEIHPSFLARRSKQNRDQPRSETLSPSRTLEVEILSTSRPHESLAPSTSGSTTPRPVLAIPQERSSSRQLQHTDSSNAETEGLASMSPKSEIFYPSLEAQEDNHERQKRRLASEDEVYDFPSSSPPEVHRNKRQRQENTPLPNEIASTPDQSPLHNNTTRSPRFVSRPAPSTMKFGSDVEAEETDVSNVEESTQEDIRPQGRRASPVLSESEHTPFIDLDVPLPEEGWDDEEIDNLDTQALLNGTTQLPDLSLPDPEDGLGDQVPTSPPELPSSPTEDLSQEEVNARLEEWINTHVAAGSSTEDAITALECTSLDHRLADQVLEHMATNHGRIPPDMRGVWTDSDEEDMHSTDARKILAVEEKHGTALYNLRWEFLEAYKK